MDRHRRGRARYDTLDAIDEVVGSAASDVARCMENEGVDEPRVSERDLAPAPPRARPLFEATTERVPAVTLEMLAQHSLEQEIEQPSSLSAFEVPARGLWARMSSDEAPTLRKQTPGDFYPRRATASARARRGALSAWLLGGMGLVVGLATGVAIVMRSQMDEVHAPASPPPPAVEELPPTTVVAPQIARPRPAKAVRPATSASPSAPKN